MYLLPSAMVTTIGKCAWQSAMIGVQAIAISSDRFQLQVLKTVKIDLFELIFDLPPENCSSTNEITVCFNCWSFLVVTSL